MSGAHEQDTRGDKECTVCGDSTDGTLSLYGKYVCSFECKKELRENWAYYLREG